MPTPGIMIWSKLVIGPVEERVSSPGSIQKETNLLVRLSRESVLGWTLALAVSLAGAGCARVGAQPTGVGGSGGSGGTGGDTGGTGGSAGDDAGPPLNVFGDGGLDQMLAVCGNSIVESTNENCDDGNNVSGDGCSSECAKEPKYTCLMPGKPCVHDPECGDGMIEAAEACDDGNTAGGDGCAADCMAVECGWECPGGKDCRAAKCGDGKVAGKEQCDDGNNTDGDGCSAICTLESKPVAEKEGWVCTSPTAGGADGGAASCKGPTTCTTTVCGNGKIEGSEQCDDGNMATGDKCSPFCRLEPVCPPGGGACTSACGDGLLLPIRIRRIAKNCDDGNTVDGADCGCSSIRGEGRGGLQMLERHGRSLDEASSCSPSSIATSRAGTRATPPTATLGTSRTTRATAKRIPGIVQPDAWPDRRSLFMVAGCFPMLRSIPGRSTANLCAPGGTPAPTRSRPDDQTVDWFGQVVHVDERPVQLEN